MSWVVVASIFTMFLSPKNGLINGVITALGGDSIYFLANEKWWRPIFYMIAVWKDIGWGTIIYIAALSGVDMEQHEAAVLDGATRFQRVIYLTLPAISGTIVTVFILNLAKVLNLFDPVWVLQNSMVVNTSDVWKPMFTAWAFPVRSTVCPRQQACSNPSFLSCWLPSAIS